LRASVLKHNNLYVHDVLAGRIKTTPDRLFSVYGYQWRAARNYFIIMEPRRKLDSVETKL